MPDSSFLDALAHALLAGPPSADLLIERCSRTLGRRWRWIRPLTERYRKKFRGTRPRHREVTQFLRADAGLLRAWLKHSEELSVQELLIGPQTMRPAPAAETWDVPAIESSGDLAKWLGLDPGEMWWFADLRGLGYKPGTQPLRHYHYRVLAKRFGSVRAWLDAGCR